MTDVGSHHFVKGGSGVSVPQPSDDPHDPLNWSTKWKTMAIAASTSVSFVQGFGPSSLAPTFPIYMAEFGCTLAQAVKFTGVAILVLGFSNFICSNGIGAGPAESIQPAVIADIFFLHDRGFWNTSYWTFYMGSSMVAPIICGSMSAAVGWRNFWWLNVGITGLSLLMVIFMFPETRWHRSHPDEIIANIAAQEAKASPAGSQEKVAPGAEAVEKRDPESLNSTPTRTNATMPDLSLSATAARDPYLGKGSPSKAQWASYQPNAHPFKSMASDLWIPWKSFAFPIVEFAAFVVSWSCSSFSTLNLTQSQNFAAPPYNFDGQTIGFFNFAISIGAVLGSSTAGKVSIMIIGNVVVALGYQRKWSWKVIVIVGYTCAGIQVAALPAMASTYAVDSYKPVAASLFVAITVNKNVWGYGFSEFITPWIDKAGFIPPIMTNMASITFFCSSGIVFFFFGKKFRRWSRNSSVHRM